MAHFHPPYPYFTISVCNKGILREPYRLIDVGVRGGLQDHWWFFGDHLEAWGFDPQFDEGVGPLIAANPYPERIHYFNYGLGDDDAERNFRFLPENPSSSFFAASNSTDPVDATWEKRLVRRLDTLFSDGTLGRIDFMKLDAETYEVEIIRGAREFFKRSGIFGIESEVNFFRTKRNPRSHFVSLYDELAPHGFVVYDAGLQRKPRAPLANGYPKDLDTDRYAIRPIGQPNVFDMLFLRETFDSASLQGKVRVDVLIKMICTAELYGLQDVGLDILLANTASLGRRFDVEEAADWLVREKPGTRLTYQEYRRDSASWHPLAPREPTVVHYEGQGDTTSVIPVEPGAATDADGAAIMVVSHPAELGCGRLWFHVRMNFAASEENVAIVAVCQAGRSVPVAILTVPVSQGGTAILDREFAIPIERHAQAPTFNIRVGLASSRGTLFLNRPAKGNGQALLASYVRICDDDHAMAEKAAITEELLREKDVFSDKAALVTLLFREREELLAEKDTMAELLQRERDGLAEKAVLAERLLHEKEVLLAGKKATAELLLRERDALIEKTAVAELFLREKDALLAEKHAATEVLARERDALAEKDAMAQNLIREREAQLAEKGVAAEQLAKERTALAEKMVVAELLLREKDALLAQKDAEAESQQSRLLELERRIDDNASLLAQKDMLLVERDAVVTSLYDSRSWRMTAPLRRVATLLGR